MIIEWFKKLSSCILHKKYTSCLQHWTWISLRERVKSLTIDWISSWSKVLLPSKVTTLCFSRHYRCQRWVSINVKKEVGNLTAGSNSYVKIFSIATETRATWLLSRSSCYRLFSQIINSRYPCWFWTQTKTQTATTTISLWTSSERLNTLRKWFSITKV